MSSGETGGLDLTVETLEYIDSNWKTVARTFDRAITDSTTDPDTVWTKPVLRNHNDKTIYPDGGASNYSASLRANDVVTVEDAGRADSPTGTEYDSDVQREVDVTCEALNAGFTVVDGSTDWQVFIHIVRRSILTARVRPITDPACKFDWRWIEIYDQSPLPETQGNRDHYGSELSTRWHGYEDLPAK